MFLFVLGYVGSAAAFYALITKTAKMEPDNLAIAQPAPNLATVIEIHDQFEKRAA